MNVIFKNINKNRTNQSQKRQKSKNYFINFGSKDNLYLSENQRNLTNFNSQKKIKQKGSNSNNKNNIKNKESLVAFNNNNIKLKNFSNLIDKTSNGKKNNNKRNKSHYLSKPQLEIEINNRNNSNNVIACHSKLVNNKIYKKNISEHDLVNNILNTFTNFPKRNINLNFSSKKKLENYDKNKIKRDNTTDNKKLNQNGIKPSSDTKLLRSSSGYSPINTNLAQTNSFFNGNGPNQLGYISTYGNNPDLTNNNISNMIRISNQKKNNNNIKHINNNKGPIIGKIIKTYKNNDLNCIFNINLIPPATHINDIQDYFKNLYKNEYSDNRYKKFNNHKKRSLVNEDKEKEKEEKINNDDYSHSKNTMTKTNDISRIKKEKDSIDNVKYYNDSPEEIHFYVISSIQNGKNMENNLVKK